MLKKLPQALAESIQDVSLVFEMERHLLTDEPAVQSWHVQAVVRHWDEPNDNGDPRTENVVSMHIVKGSLVDGDLWNQLDALEGDLEAVGSSVLEDGDLREEVLDLCQGGAGGANLMILNSVIADARWRGYGVGAFLAGEAIQALADDCGCVATYPAPLDRTTDDQREKAISKLARVWESIGFQRLDDDVMVLDPSSIRLGEALARMRHNFGLR
jgi:GNAT superfamily N-acetyltransferase